MQSWYLTINACTIRAIISKNKFELFIENWSYSYDQYRVFVTYHRMRANSPSWAGTRHNRPLCQILLLESGGGSVCGGSVGSGTQLCMIQELECKTESHSKTPGQERRGLFLVNGKGAWFVMVPPASRTLKLAYFQPFLPQEVTEQEKVFTGLPRSECTLERWSGVFQVIH